MGSQNPFFLLLLFFLLIFSGSATASIPSTGGRRSSESLPKTLFVFGDSYADTGNTEKSSNVWNYPYGITFPGKPTGRASDGRVLTDYLALFLGIESPVPYERRNDGVEDLKNGMNFAYGGTGAFFTNSSYPNMTVQINLFKQIITNSSYYSVEDIQSSIAHVSAAGNDYAFYLINGNNDHSLLGWITFMEKLNDQLFKNLKRIAESGVPKILVTGLQPLGCVPVITAKQSFLNCNETYNSLVKIHNLFLQLAVVKLNYETPNSTFHVLDLYSSFTSVLKNNGSRRSSLGSSTRFETPLKPCCAGVTINDYCGKVDENGERNYTLCKDPKAAFFWDVLHPTNEGWSAVYSLLKPFLKQIL